MKTAYNVGIYCRLSREDKKNTKKTDSSLSIENQQAMLEKYVATQGWNVYRVYVDDGVSGTTFDRPQFQAMIRDIEDGKVNCVVTKDAYVKHTLNIQIIYLNSLYTPNNRQCMQCLFYFRKLEINNGSICV